MKARCFNQNSKKFQRYGARGIKVCDRWLLFENFLADMGKRPSRAYSIERSDNDGDYCPDNCEWMLTVRQARNRSDTFRVEMNGQIRALADLADEHGISLDNAYHRVHDLGWNVIEALTTPLCANGSWRKAA